MRCLTPETGSIPVTLVYGHPTSGRSTILAMSCTTPASPQRYALPSTHVLFNPTNPPTSAHAQNAHHCVAAATASSATGPFTAPSAPFICDDAGGGVIDISGFQAPDGQRYVVWKVDGSAINSNSTPIRLQRVQADGVTLEGEVYTLINRDASDGPLVEAPSLVFWDGCVPCPAVSLHPFC